MLHTSIFYLDFCSFHKQMDLNIWNFKVSIDGFTWMKTLWTYLFVKKIIYIYFFIHKAHLKVSSPWNHSFFISFHYPQCTLRTTYQKIQIFPRLLKSLFKVVVKESGIAFLVHMDWQEFFIILTRWTRIWAWLFVV